MKLPTCQNSKKSNRSTNQPIGFPTSFASRRRNSTCKQVQHRILSNLYSILHNWKTFYLEIQLNSNDPENYCYNNELQKHSRLDKSFLQQIEIDLIKQKIPQLYTQLHKKMNSFLDQFIDLLRDKVTNLKQYEIIQEFYKQISFFIQNHSSIRSYQSQQVHADTSSSHSISGKNHIVVK
jgi:hypothetical protein